MNKTNYYILCLVPLMVLLTSCGDNHRLKELQKNVAQLKETAANTKKENVMDEFELPPATESAISTSETAKKAQHPTNGNPLQSYPLKSLRFVGVMTQNNKIWAYVMTPDGMIYQAKEGDVLGDNYGKITKIDSNHIDIEEKNVAPGNANSTLQKVTIQLKE